ncbi:MAG: methyltransferase domain-containing protein [Proteobacteria bacterium]|nr:methyltransferase domain-containing protein [Pseudomonadota bacterium]MBU1743214.1 methyltransferase domain-containing protein [Pseudomonadota bacterium]
MSRQVDIWKGQFGDDYTARCDREPNAARREVLTRALDISRPRRILDIGSNTGRLLQVVRSGGEFKRFGLEPNKKAIRLAQSRLPDVGLVEGTTAKLPFKDRAFDLVYTFGVLIHIAPAEIASNLREIVRVCRGYVLFYEYYAEDWTEIDYRGQDRFLWKTDYRREYLAACPELEEVQFELVPLEDGLFDSWGLLRVGSPAAW